MGEDAPNYPVIFLHHKKKTHTNRFYPESQMLNRSDPLTWDCPKAIAYLFRCKVYAMRAVPWPLSSASQGLD